MKLSQIFYTSDNIFFYQNNAKLQPHFYRYDIIMTITFNKLLYIVALAINFAIT